jgi:hypothetical protein
MTRWGQGTRDVISGFRDSAANARLILDFTSHKGISNQLASRLWNAPVWHGTEMAKIHFNQEPLENRRRRQLVQNLPARMNSEDN